ncbi:tetratricopeptide repeat protein [Aeromonas enteropelogenes]|uniref:tetratricopeptide repeat protein n=1 Tax=Aeromonas enteropelogenes TaxID=29489 RepID=UPI0030CC879F
MLTQLLSSYLHCLKKFFLICLICFFIPVSHASTKHVVETETAASQLIGVLYTNQQMQLETVKEQQRLELGKLHDKLSDIDSRVENFQADLNNQKQVVESSRQEIAATGKRIDDSLIYSGQSLDRFGLGITIVLAVVGFVGYFSFAEKTKREAEGVAKKWFENQACELQEQISELQREVMSARGKITSHIDDFERFAEESKAEIQRNGTIATSVEQGEAFDLSPVVQKRSDFLKNIPTSNYKYDDWNSLAYASYSKQNFEEAALYWLRASEDTGASDVEIAISLYNRGLAQSYLNQIEAAVATYDEVIHRFGDSTDPMLQESVAKALVNKGYLKGQHLGPDVAIGIYDEVIRRFGNAVEQTLKEQVAKALVNRGVLEGQQNKQEAALNTYEEVVRRFSDVKSSVLEESVAKALVNTGILQAQLSQLDAAVETYSGVVRRFGGAADLVLKESVAKSLLGKGYILGEASQSDAAIDSYDEVVCRFGDASEPVLKELVARALVNKGFLLGQKPHPDDAVEIYNEVVRRFGNATELVLKEQVARALVNKGRLLEQEPQPDAAINCYEEVIQRFGQATEVVLKEQVVNALMSKGFLLGKDSMPDAAIGTYQEVIQRFGDAQESVLKEAVAHAYNSIGFYQLCKGKLDLTKDDTVAAKDKFRKAIEYFDTALSYLELKKINGYIVGNRAYSLALLGEIKEAESVFATALRAPLDGGEKLYEATLKDLDTNPIPQDEQIRALVDIQWGVWLSEQSSLSEVAL